MELWDILDENGNATGEKIIRGRGMPKGKYHLAVHIWPKNSKGELLIQRRALHLRDMPGEWAATSGSAIAGETSLESAYRELGEELGIYPIKEKIEFVCRIKRPRNFIDLYKMDIELDPSALKLQDEEVCTAKWVSVNELKKMVQERKFHNYGKTYFDILFSI